MKFTKLSTTLALSASLLISSGASAQNLSLPLLSGGALLNLPGLLSSLPGLDSGVPGLDVLPVGDVIDLAGPVLSTLLTDLPVGNGLEVLNPVLTIIPNGLTSLSGLDLPDLGGNGSLRSDTLSLDVLPISTLLVPVSELLQINTFSLPIIGGL